MEVWIAYGRVERTIVVHVVGWVLVTSAAWRMALDMRARAFGLSKAITQRGMPAPMMASKTRLTFTFDVP